MGTLLLDGLTKRYGEATAVAGVDLDIRQGELVALLGPSGCGKTTTLRMVAGFIEPSAGRVVIGGRDVTRLPPHARDTGMVFQSYALFPHMSVADNVGFGLEMRKVGKAERDRRIAEALRLVRLDALADRLPRQLSGGQQQRVALARALVVSPAVFLLDEPLSNLDAKLRSEVGLEIRELQKRLGLTTLMVTHDQDEALAMADRLVVMEHGRVLQVGSAEDLYERPANTFVAGFVGRCNLLDGTREGADVFRLASGAAVPCAPD
ncbi:ABC transporter ATP-binding protein, partial [Methylobacterium ajmalii]